MDKITIVFWSQGGNTAAMAAAVAEGVKAAGREAEIVPVSEASLDELKAADAFAMGCPAMGAEALEEYEMEPFVADVENFVSGKRRWKNKIFPSRDLCLRALDTNSLCARNVRRNGEKNEIK